MRRYLDWRMDLAEFKGYMSLLTDHEYLNIGIESCKRRQNDDDRPFESLNRMLWERFLPSQLENDFQLDRRAEWKACDAIH